MEIVLVAVFSYFCGSIPFGLILTQIFIRQDIRKIGSGNIGATNVARVAGKKLGILTLFLDASKGLFCVLTAFYLGLPVAAAAVFGLFAFFYADDPNDSEESQIDVQLAAEQFPQPVLRKNSDPAPNSSDNASPVVNPRATSNEMPKLMPPAKPELPPIDQIPEDTPPSAPIVTPTPEETAPDVQLIDENDIRKAAPPEPDSPLIAPAIEVPVQPADCA